MKLYLRVFLNGWKESSIYKFDVIMNGFLSIFRILIVFLMWSVIFSSRTEVKGFTLSMMLTYYIVIMLLQKMDTSESIANMMSGEIREGKYSKYIVKPMSSFFYYFFRVMSKMTYYLIFSIVSVVFWIVCFNQYFLLPSSGLNLLYAIVIFLLGLLFMYGFNYFIMILTFWFSNTSSFFQLKRKILEFMTGAIIPLSLLPDNVVQVFKILPFYYVYYFPASIYLGQNTMEIPFALGVLLTWNLVLFTSISFIYNKAIKSFSGVGI